MRHSRGFTLIELLVTVVVLGILTAIAVPSFQSWIQSSRTLTVTDELNTAIQLARSEALKRRKSVIICRANADWTACENGTDWSKGWLIRQVTNNAGNPGDIVRVWQAATGSVVTGPNTGITFASNGLGSGATKLEVQVTGCADSTKRVIDVTTTGNTASSKGTCTPP